MFYSGVQELCNKVHHSSPDHQIRKECHLFKNDSNPIESLMLKPGGTLFSSYWSSSICSGQHQGWQIWRWKDWGCLQCKDSKLSHLWDNCPDPAYYGEDLKVVSDSICWSETYTLRGKFCKFCFNFITTFDFR